MNELIIKQQTLDSREVAEMMGIDHKKLLRKIKGDKERKGYIDILTETQMGLSEYFIENSYKDSSGKENKCYSITKKGCELIAHKVTGEKGVVFTIKYIEKFHAMEDYIIKQQKEKILEDYKKELEQKFEQNTEHFKEITEKAESLMKLTHKNKLYFNKFIKTLVANKEEVEAVKIYVLASLNCTAWQDVPVNKYAEVIKLIKEIAPIVTTKKFEQLNLFREMERVK